MNSMLNKLIVLMSLFCLLIGYQNFGRVQSHEISRIDFKSEMLEPKTAVQFIPVLSESKKIQLETAQGCAIKPQISKANEDQRIWFKADWGGSECAKPAFMGWLVYDAEGELVTGLENRNLMGHAFAQPGKYTVILSYSALKGTGEILRERPEVLDQVQFDINVE